MTLHKQYQVCKTPIVSDNSFSKTHRMINKGTKLKLKCFFIYGLLQAPYVSRIVRKPDFCLGENKGADTRIVQFLFFLNPKFQASSLLLSLYSPVCVGPGRKSRRPVFSRRGSCNGKLCFSINSNRCHMAKSIKWLFIGGGQGPN